MLQINWQDVVNVLDLCIPYLIAFAVVLVLGIVASIACMKLAAHHKYLIRRESALAVLLALVIVVNLICFGPMSTLLTLSSGEGRITAESLHTSETLVEDIAGEGIVLLKNEDQCLPMTGSSNINVFGWSSTNPCYGGVGSGAMSDAYPIVSLLEGLENAGLQVNQELSDFYTSFRSERPEVGMFSQDWTLPEPPANTYSQELIDGAKSFSDTAIIVLSRSGGEHIDLPRDVSTVNYTDNGDYQDFPAGTHYLEPSQSEYDMIDLVCTNFDNVVLVYNGANTMEMGFVADHPQIKSVVWCPSPGQNGFNALGRIVTGAVNPSAKTPDTFVADLLNTPTSNNFGDFTYDNMSEFETGDHPFFPGQYFPTFVNYVEGIYVGYRFYETAAEEGLIDYDEVVLYPFGHGLSYTTFSKSIENYSQAGGEISFDVRVTNTGTVAGKDVVEIYYNPPYINGGIEKASANLVAFGKTGELAPGASEDVAISFNVEDMASFDAHGAGAYVLEAGDYIISINSDSHNVIDSQTYTVNSTIAYGESNKRESDLVAATAQFDFAEGADKVYLSRADGFANFAEATAAPTSTEMAESDKAGFFNNGNWTPPEDSNAVMPTTGAKNGLTLADLRGKDINDPQWDDLLDQLTVEEMVELVAMGGYQTVAAPSVGKLATTDCDGPASINNNFTGQGSIGFPCGVMIASTWSVEIARDFGESIGAMADDMGVSGWYAPAMNMHRNAFSGRNFEYYSEDGFLSGKIAFQAVQGAWNHGVYAYIKHFAMNEMETNRWGMLTTWSTEQAIREIYLKPFEICVKEARNAGALTAVMSSYNYIGNQWAGACDALQNTVLRNEWGFDGFVVSDWGASNDHTAGVAAGSHLEMPTTGGDSDLELVESVKSGKLAETYPVKYEDVSSAPYFPAKERTAEYRESLYVGYRYFETVNDPVLFPFGFGLSYTTFEYSDLTVNDKEASFTLKNTGKVDGAEVAQLYVSKTDGEVFRPAKELKGFQKVFLKAGESEKVTIKLDDKAFRYFNVNTNKFEIEGGEWNILIGASAADIKLSGKVSVEGTSAVSPYNKAKLADYFSGNIKNIPDSEFEALLGRPIPDGSWSGTLDMNDAICQLYYAKSGIARFAYKIMTNMLNKSIAKGEPDLNITFIYNMPFRGIAKMAGGMCTMEMAEGILTVCNGHFFKGMGAIIGGFFRSGKRRKAAEAIH